MSRFEQAYLIYSDFRQHSSWHAPVSATTQNAEKFVLDHLARSAGLRPIDTVVGDLNEAGFPCPPEAYNKAHELYSVIEEVHRSKWPLPDAYAAALTLINSTYFLKNPRRRAYRGQQNNCWPMYPKIYRCADAHGELVKLEQFVAVLRKKHSNLSEEQAIALAQHYSREGNVATWLLDLTEDPLIALFFASTKGHEGEVGVVTCFETSLWTERNPSGKNRLGVIRFLNVPNNPRIQAQRATFLYAAHPAMIEQYIPMEVQFRQTSLQFVDPSIGISEDQLFPPNDEFRDFASEFAAASRLGENYRDPKISLDHLLPPDPRTNLSTSDYLVLVQDQLLAWIERSISQTERECFRSVLKELERDLFTICKFHKELQRERDINRVSRSLTRLFIASEHLCMARADARMPSKTIAEVIEDAYHNTSPASLGLSQIRTLLDRVAQGDH